MAKSAVQLSGGADREGPRPTRIQVVMGAVRQRIAVRSLTTGDRLPSVRAAAAAMGVSTSTVVEAYERLAAEGVIRSRPGSGFFVGGTLPPLAVAQMGPEVEREVDPFWVSRQALGAEPAALKPGCGWLPASWLPLESLRKAIRSLNRADDAALADYSTPLGLPPLRKLLAHRLADRGIQVSPDQIMLTESGTQAIDLLCRLIIEPGDTVLLDDPCYFNFQALLRAHRARTITVPYTPSGPDIGKFAAVLAEQRPRLYLTNSGIHNPTGATLSAVTAHRILKLAEQANMIIVEDDIFADFEHAVTPRLAAFDGLDRVVHIGSFSKTLSASARVGYIAAKRDWLERLLDLKIATSFGGGRMAQELVLSLLRDGGYRKHMESLRLRLSHAMSDVQNRLTAQGFRPWLRPAAGMFLWCQAPDGIDTTELSRLALAEDIVLGPGNAFSLNQSAGTYLRFNVAQSGDERLYEFLRKARRGGGGKGKVGGRR